MKPWTIRAVEFARTNIGWRCEIAYRFQTHAQFTMEDHAIASGAKGHGPISILVAYLRTRRSMRRWIAHVQSIPGPWNLDGTPDNTWEHAQGARCPGCEWDGLNHMDPGHTMTGACRLAAAPPPPREGEDT